MRVAFVTGEYPPLQGGVGAFTREVARAMAHQGHKVHVLTREKSAETDDPGITVHEVASRRWTDRSSRLVLQYIDDIRLDVVNIQYQTAAYDMHWSLHTLPSRIREIPVVVTFHDLRVPYLFPKAGPVRKWAVRKLARDADGCIATDRADEKTLVSQWDIDPVCWIPIGSNVTAQLPRNYDRDHYRSVLGAGTDDLLISYFGFLNESKGGLTLLEALKLLRDRGLPARLVMIGGRAGASDPTNLAYAKKMDTFAEAHGLGPVIHWTGFVHDEEVSAAFCASDVTALPYLDGVSLRRGTLMAALAHGRAIVTTHPQTDAPELEHVVVTVSPGDSEALAQTIAALWDDSARRRTLENAAQQASQHFEWPQIAAKTLDFFKAISSE